MNSVKLIYKNSIKRLEEEFHSLEELNDKITNLFNINNKINNIKIFYSKDGNENLITTTQDLQTAIKNHKGFIPKFSVLLDPISFDDLVKSENNCSSLVYSQHGENNVKNGDISNDCILSSEFIEEDKEIVLDLNIKHENEIDIEFNLKQTSQNQQQIKDINDDFILIKKQFTEGLKQFSVTDKELLNFEKFMERKFSELQIRILQKLQVLTPGKQELQELHFRSSKTQASFSNNNKAKEELFNGEGFDCDVCKTHLTSMTYYNCIICTDMNLCSKCENLHIHPTIKFKSRGDFLSKQNIRKLLNSFEKELPNREIKTSYYKADVKLNSSKDSDLKVLKVKPNCMFEIPLIVYNKGNNTIPLDSMIIVRNTKDIIVNPQRLMKDLPNCEIGEIILNCESKEANSYSIEIIIFHKDIEIQTEVLHIVIEVVDQIDFKDEMG